MIEMDRHAQNDNNKKPWRERKDWAKGIANDTVKSMSHLELWFATIFFTVFFIPFGVVLYSHFLEQDPQLIWIAFIPPGISLLLLVIAIVVMFRRRKNNTWFELDTVPGVLGGFLRGTVPYNDWQICR